MLDTSLLVSHVECAGDRQLGFLNGGGGGGGIILKVCLALLYLVIHHNLS